VDRVHRRRLMGPRPSLNSGCWLPDRWLRLNLVNCYLSRSSLIRQSRRLAAVGGGVGSRSRRRVTTEHGGSPEFEFSQATVVSFRWGLLLRDHSDEGNVFMLTLITRERQQSPTMVRWLDRCLVMVRAASGEASAPRTCAKASSSSLLASRPTNCFDRRRKTRIWFLPRVRRVLDLRLKIHTICGAIYRGFYIGSSSARTPTLS
jgi:hypothetical protein